ncbi:MAG: biotin transporter BioY [Syntrophomonadaceae bacterium]|jgi:biotin transport system substrate-specific component|nr:biotin transporter BioY [Syntrophomonadaceae bacterium]
MKISTKELVWAAMFTAIMCVVTIVIRLVPLFGIIPFSLLPLVMMLAAYLLSPRAVFLSFIAYVLLGLIGLPVFALPPYGGPGYVLMPSFGFMLGFSVAGWVQAKLLRRDSSNSLLRLTTAAIVAMLVYYAIGLPYMYMILNFYMGRAVDVVQVLKIGFIPFVGFDLLKMVAAIFLAKELRERLGVLKSVRVN